MAGKPWERDWSGQAAAPIGVGGGTAPRLDLVRPLNTAQLQGAAAKPWERDWSGAAIEQPASPPDRSTATTGGQTISAARTSLWDRVKEVAGDTIEHSPVGAVARWVSGVLPGSEDYSAGGDNSQAAQGARAQLRVVQDERNRREAYVGRTADDPWQRPNGTTLGNAARFGADAIGMLAGGAADPTNLIAPGGSILAKMAGQAAVGGVVDAATQGVEMGQGVRDGFDPLQTGVSAAGGAALVGAIEGAPALRAWWRARGANLDHVPDEALVSGSLDGSLGEGMSSEQLQAILRGGGADADHFSSPELAAAAAQRMQAAQARAPLNVAPEELARHDTLLAAIATGETDPAFAPQLPPRVVPPDVPIIAAPEGAIRGDDAGSFAGVERKRAADAGVLDAAQRRVADDPVVASILDSNLSAQAKVATLWDRIGKVRETNASAAGPDLPEVPATPAVAPWQRPTADEARVPPGSGRADFMARVRSRESGGDDSARAKTSSATGRYQFTDATWLGTYKARFGADGLTDAQILAKRADGALQDRLMGDLTNGNAAAIRAAGHADTAGNLYLAHFLGRKGGVDVLNADPRTPIDQIVGRQAVEANRTILAGKTAGDVVAWTNQRMGGAAPEAPWRMSAPDEAGDGFYSGRTRPNRGGTPMNPAEDLGAPTSPTNAQRAAGFDQEAPTQTGGSDRLFRSVADDPEGQPGFWEQRARQQGDEARTKAQADLEAEWTRREQARAEQAASAGPRMEQERTGTTDPSGIYGKRYEQRPHETDGVWHTTREGYVAGKTGNPVAFRSPREAAKWAAANKMGGDFELASWGKFGGKDSTRVVLKRRDGSGYGQVALETPRPRGPLEPAAGRSVDQSQRAVGGPEAPQSAQATSATLRTGEGPLARPEKRGEAQRSPPALVRPERTAANVGEARRTVRAIVGQPIRNEATGVEATISNGTLGKMTSEAAISKSSSVDDHLLAVANVDHLFRTAHLIERGPDKKGEPTLSISRWRAHLSTPAGDRSVKITVKETSHPGTPNPLYTVETAEVEPARVASREREIERAPDQGRYAPQAGSPGDVSAPSPVVERPPIPAETRPALPGDREEVVTARGRPIETQFEVREARDLVTSDHPAFDPRFQPRDRSGRSSSDAQIAEMASRLDPERLHSARDAAQGAPIIGPDRVVESGNGRVAALRRMYEQHPEGAAAYKDMLKARGMDPEGFDQPVLVRRRTGDLDDDGRAAFVREANERDTMAMSSTEQARADAGAMSDVTLGRYRGGGVADASNREFVRAWMDEVATPAERNTLMQADGSLSADGVRRMRTSLLSKAFDDPDLVAKIVEDPDGEIRTIGNTLTDAAPAFAKIKQRIAEGDLPVEFDITPHVAEMAKLIARARAEGKHVGDLLDQRDIFAGDAHPNTRGLVGLMFKGRDMKRPRSAGDMAEGLRFYSDEAGKMQSGPSLFGDAMKSAPAIEVLAAARKKLDERDFARGKGGESLRDLWSDETGALDIEPIAKLLGRLFDGDAMGKDGGALIDKVREAFGEPRAALKGTLTKMGQFAEAAAYTSDGQLRAMAGRLDAPTIAKVADMFHAQAGKADGVGRTYHEAIDRGVRVRMQRAHDGLEAHLNSDAAMGRIRDLLATPNRRVSATTAEREAATKVRDILKDILAYRRAAGEDLGEVTDGYFPRVIDPDAVAKAPTKFLRGAERLYRDAGADDPAGAAAAWARRISDTYAGIDGGLDHFGTSSKPSSAKAREFGKQADVLLRDFYQQDVFQTLASYVAGSVRRAEEARRFGPDGAVGSPERAAWEKAHGTKSQWDVTMEQIREELRASPGAAAGVPERILHIRDVNLGRGYASPSAIVSTLHAWNQLGLMDRATVSSLGDLAMGFVRGGPRYGVEHLATSVREFGRKVTGADQSDASRYAEAVGTANDVYASHLIQARVDTGNVGAGAQKVLDKFYRATGLQQLTEGGRIAATKTGQHFLRDLAHDLQSPTARTRVRAAGYLRELGVRDPAAFGSQLRTAAPTREQLLGDVGFSADYATALLRYVNQSILMPTRAERPTWASHPVGGLFFALQSYSWGFTKNALQRVGRETGAAVRERDPARLGAASGLVVLAGMTYLTDTYLRPTLYGSNYDFENETGAEAVLRTADRAGFTGGLSPLVNAFKGMKYQRSLADSLSGSIAGRISDGVTKVGALAGERNSDDTNTAERNAAAAVYDLAIEPALDLGAVRYLKGAGRSAGVALTGNRNGTGLLPNDREGFVSRVAGAKVD